MRVHYSVTMRIPFSRLKIGKKYRIDHFEKNLQSKSGVLQSVGRGCKTYCYEHCLIYLKVYNATFCTNGITTIVYQEDEWDLTECADEILFKKIDFDFLPEDVAGEIKHFLVGSWT